MLVYIAYMDPMGIATVYNTTSNNHFFNTTMYIPSTVE